MNIVRAKLVKHHVDDWPEELMSLAVPLGKIYVIDLDSKCPATLVNLEHPEWGARTVTGVRDVGHPYCALLPFDCLEVLP